MLLSKFQSMLPKQLFKSLYYYLLIAYCCRWRTHSLLVVCVKSGPAAAVAMPALFLPPSFPPSFPVADSCERKKW